MGKWVGKNKEDFKVKTDIIVYLKSWDVKNDQPMSFKLELASKTLDGRLFGLPIWASLHSIVQDAVLKYTFSASRTQGEAMRFLGLKKVEMHKLVKKYNIDNYFQKHID